MSKFEKSKAFMIHVSEDDYYKVNKQETRHQMQISQSSITAKNKQNKTSLQI